MNSSNRRGLVRALLLSLLVLTALAGPAAAAEPAGAVTDDGARIDPNG